MGETAIQQAILLELGARPDLCRIARRNRGTAVNLKTGRGVKFGDFEGGADITGIMRDGRRLEIEVKKPGEKQTKQQREFGEMIRRYNGVYFVATSVAEAIAGVEDAARREASA